METSKVPEKLACKPTQLESDRIRNELQAQGITLIDRPEGTRWHRG